MSASAIRGFGFALVMMFGVAQAATALMTGVVDTESATNSTGLHLHDSWTLIMAVNTGGLDTYSVTDSDPFCYSGPPCITQVIFDGVPDGIAYDIIGLDVKNGHLTGMSVIAGNTWLVWPSPLGWHIGFDMDNPDVAGPITFAQLVPEPGTLGSAVLALIIGLALRRARQPLNKTTLRNG